MNRLSSRAALAVLTLVLMMTLAIPSRVFAQSEALSEDDVISGMMNTMLPPVAATGAFTTQELGQFMINAFDAAWLPRDVRDGYIGEVKRYVDTYSGSAA